MPRRQPRPPRMPPRRRMVDLLFPDDFRAAMAVAGIEVQTDEATLQVHAEYANTVVQAALSAQVSPALGDLQATAAALAAIRDNCETALAPILAHLQPLAIDESEPRASLAGALMRSQDPLIIALLDVALGCDGGEDCDARLADALLAIDRLRSWADAAGRQFAAGIASRRKARQSPELRSPARAFGFALIRSYIDLTGRLPTFARGMNETAYGPLIIYLTHLFACVRDRLPGVDGHAELARARDWHPPAETLADWIERFRKAGASDSAETTAPAT